MIPQDLLLKFGYPPDNGIKFDSGASTLSFYQGGTPRVDVTSFGLAVRNGGGLVVGHTAQKTILTYTPEFQMLGTSQADTAILIQSDNTTDSQPTGVIFAKGSSGTIGGAGLVADNERIGQLLFMAGDGTDYESYVARILVEIDGTPGANDTPGRIVFSTTQDGSNGVSEALRIDSSQNVQMRTESYLWIGPDSVDTGFVDANQTLGLIINQEANDDNSITLKSSDVAHPMTAVAETDSYTAIRKASGTGGGLFITGLRDSGGNANSALLLRGALGEAADTTDTSGSLGVVEIRGSVTDGGTGTANVADAGNAISLGNNGTTRMLIKGNGDLHVTNVSAGAGDTVATGLDKYDDVQLVRATQRIASNDIGIAMSRWDEELEKSRDILIREKVLSSTGDFRIIQRYEDMLGGAIWQNYERHMSLIERVDELESQLAIANTALAVLTA
jgi:hypothetical protein